VSSKWIDSLFNSDTSRLTPLDFRLTAAAQFRLLKAMCAITTRGVNFLRKTSLEYLLVNGKTISRQSVTAQMEITIRRFNALVEMLLLSSRAPQLIIVAIRQARINSAVHTDAFHLSVPGSDHYEAISNFYPRYDNVSYNNVSSLNILSYC
jgi:hypothetical protein